MMVNWFGFATAAHTDPESRVRDQVMVAPVPSDTGHRSVSLNVYWLLSIGAGSPHAEVAWGFLRHVAAREMDRLTTLAGAIGCRRSTWNDDEVNRRIPFYRVMEELHSQAREVPSRPDWPQIASGIDWLVTNTIRSVRPVRELLQEVQSRF